jgi:hypothetical protein
MKKYFKVKKIALTGATMRLAAITLAMSLLLTNCSTTRNSQSSQDNSVDTYEPVELTDDCALLHVYRPSSMKGSLISYNLNLDDETVFRVKNKSKTTVRITGEGVITLWAKTETRVELPVEVQPGNEYYIRCTVGFGAFVGRPKMELVDNQTGKYEFDAIRMK